MTELQDRILQSTGASSIIESQHVQTLWSEYGEIRRYWLNGASMPSVIVKNIQLPEKSQHPKGWNTSQSHQRKLKSYKVECHWYEQYAKKINLRSRVPNCLQTHQDEHSFLIILEDLDASGYARRIHHDKVSLEEAKECLRWLAHFHGQFMGEKGEGLWPMGTYWHLDTRPDELERMKNLSLRQVASRIDERLNNATYQTLVHGDAKLANFCFGTSSKVAAVDFQYVGRGCGMKDVAYFISSCFHEDDCERYEQELLNHYFNTLEVSLNKAIDFQLLKAEWITLYPFAWADFYRFLDGWSPGHWKMHNYSKRLTQQVIDELGAS